MDYLALFGIAVGLSMDAFAVALTNGAVTRNLKLKHALGIALAFGAFQAVMPTICLLYTSRRADPQMDLLGPRLPQHAHNTVAGGSPDNGVIQHNDPLSLYCGNQRVKLDPHAVAPFLLGRLNKGPANVIIFYNALFIGNPGLLTVCLLYTSRCV